MAFMFKSRMVSRDHDMLDIIGAYLEVLAGPGVSLNEHVVVYGTQPRLQPPQPRPRRRISVDVLDERGLGANIGPRRTDTTNSVLEVQMGKDIGQGCRMNEETEQGTWTRKLYEEIGY